MKKILLGAVALVAIGVVPAFAADLPAKVYAKAPPPVVVAAYNWTGFYVGGDVGGAWARTSVANNFLPSAAAFTVDNEAFKNSASSIVGSVHAGYNWQVSPSAVLGVEADWSGLRANSSSTVDWLTAGVASCSPVTSCFTTMSTNISWLASVRGRAGVLVSPNVLLYATGGVAWGRLAYAGEANNGSGYVGVFNGSSTNVGYVAGGGVEWMVAANWLVRAEYLYYSLGKGPNSSVFPAPPFGNNFDWGRTTVNTVRLGLSYKFGGPVVARY
jgi:outer membrane immunogenic protein